MKYQKLIELIYCIFQTLVGIFLLQPKNSILPGTIMILSAVLLF